MSLLTGKLTNVVTLWISLVACMTISMSLSVNTAIATSSTSKCPAALVSCAQEAPDSYSAASIPVAGMACLRETSIDSRVFALLWSS
jgi:hypothetical protein